MLRAYLPAVCLTLLAATNPAIARTACEALPTAPQPSTQIARAETIAAGALQVEGDSAGAPAQYRDLPAFCRVIATIRPVAGSEIGIEVWLPSSNWNGKFQAVGNGGWAGSITYPAMADALRRGYATASTDTGHRGPGATFIQDNPEKLIDFGYRSVHEMTVKAKALIAAFYGEAPRLSYWNGCSTGGRQALMEAQRFPGDYDGIIGGDPATPKARLNAWQLAVAKTIRETPGGLIPPAKLPAVHDAVMAACDTLDGLKDALLQDPTRCTFDPASLACKEGDGPACLTPAQVSIARTMVSQVRDPKTGATLYPGLSYGAERAWNVIGGPEPSAIAVEQFKFVVFKDPKWDWQTFDFHRDMPRAEEADRGIIDVPSADLKPFAARGGKLLLYHGWADPQIPPLATVEYYQRVQNTVGASARDAFRLFMVPGMGHCRGGDAPNTFDVVSALEQWVEHGKPPARIDATLSIDGKVVRSMPLCPYPQIARHNGKGSPNDAASFVCATP